MSDYNEFENDRSRKFLLEEKIKRLRAKIKAGDDQLRPELAEVIMQAAQHAATDRLFDIALRLVDDAVIVVEELISEGQIEFQTSLGRCFLFRAAVLRLYRGPEAGLKAFNETIRYFSERADDDNPFSQNELAVALMNKSDLLMDPFGAYSAAIAAQDQAVRIWQRLVDRGNTEFRYQLVSTLLTCGDSKIQSGDIANGLENFCDAVAVAKEGVADGSEIFYPILIQSQVKLARLYDQMGDLQHAFEMTREAIQIVQELIDSGETQAEIMLTTLHLQQGMLFERTSNSQAALDEFDRCREIYLDMIRSGRTSFPGNYLLRTGLANIFMCRGNMLADLKRFEDAAESFDESIRQYQRASESRPENDEDETFLPYSVGVVRLNYANMLATQGNLDEAVALKELALTALRQRMDAGHSEILPNLHSAYRKMIGILRMQGKIDEMSVWIDKLIEILVTAVDDGKMEYRTDLASVYQLRGLSLEEKNDFAAAEKEMIRAAKLYREVADEESISPEIHNAKIQWSEMLERIAVLRTRQGHIGEAMSMFQNAIDDVVGLLDEGNNSVVLDVLLAYTQFVNFVEVVIRSSNFTDAVLKDGSMSEQLLTRLKKLSNIDPNADELPEGITQHSPEEFHSWLQNAMKSCEAGVLLSQRQLLESKEPLSEMFFSMKIAYFRKMHGSLAILTSDYEKAYDDFARAVRQWDSLIDGLVKNTSHDSSSELDSSIPVRNLPMDGLGDSYMERYLFYAGELRQTLQRWANVCLELKRYEEAEQLFNRETDLTRELVQKEIPNADRFLILSLTSYARLAEGVYESDKIIALYDEARQLLRKRFLSGEFVAEDYSMFRQIHSSYAAFLAKIGKADSATKIMNDYAADIAKSREFPEPELWLELCRTLTAQQSWLTDPVQLKALRTQLQELLTQHPKFDASPQLRNYAKELKEQ
jgi:tetratricopeptide (TPR) repeat protein